MTHLKTRAKWHPLISHWSQKSSTTRHMKWRLTLNAFNVYTKSAKPFIYISKQQNENALHRNELTLNALELRYIKTIIIIIIISENTPKMGFSKYAISIGFVIPPCKWMSLWWKIRNHFHWTNLKIISVEFDKKAIL